VQGEYGAVFAIRVLCFLGITSVAVQCWSELVNYHSTEF